MRVGVKVLFIDFCHIKMHNYEQKRGVDIKRLLFYCNLCSEFDEISILIAQKHGKTRGSDDFWGSFGVKINQKKLVVSVETCRNLSKMSHIFSKNQ